MISKCREYTFFFCITGYELNKNPIMPPIIYMKQSAAAKHTEIKECNQVSKKRGGKFSTAR